MAEPPGNRDPKDPEPALVSAARYSGLGLQLAASLLIFLLGGRWLDEKLGTRPILTLLGALVGGAAGFYSLYAQLMKSQKPKGPKR